MSEHEQNKGKPSQGLRCDEWENLIADALDGTLTPPDAAAFHRHQSECALCDHMFKETSQGKAWMEYLAVEPEPPADLLQKILARTYERPQPGAGAGAVAAAVSLPAHPAWRRVVLPSIRQVLEPRLMMTLAMAFFSIALTLNLTGVKLTEIRPADFQPSRLRANLTRQYYAANEQITKYYENLRVVYEMEARVREFRRSTEPAAAPTPPAARKPAVRDGTPSSTIPQGQQIPPAPAGRYSGNPVLPAEVVQAGLGCAGRRTNLWQEALRALPSTTEGQAQRSLV
jgi:hypothetical protein